jgi:glycosyltransferase involved in cell wall biosynthesis
VHLIALVERPDHVCCRYRIAAFEPYFERAGHTLEIHALPRRWWSWLRLPQRLEGADVVIVQRKLLRGWQRWLLRRAARLLVFDFDDAVFLRDSYATKGYHSASRRRRFGGMVRAADLVVTGNSYLGAQAELWTAADRVMIVPTCVEPGCYRPANHPAGGDGVKLVWIGSSSTLQGLEAIEPLLEEIGRQVPGVSLKLICDRFLRLRNLPIQECCWSPATEARELSAADIGISYLPDDPWSPGKCGLKVLQYMAAGLPVVANPVGVQQEMVRHGETGFLVRTPGEWIGAIQRLAEDPTLRGQMGAAGRRRLETHWSVSAGASRWVGLLDRLAGQVRAA